MSVLILTAHGSADPRSAEVTRAVAHQIRTLRPGLDVRVAFCEHSEPNLRDVVANLDQHGVVTPLLLASAYHARIDIPAMVAGSGADVVRAETLGEDPRLIEVLRQRVAECATPARQTGVLVVAVGSSHAEANARTATVAKSLRGEWASVRIAYATGPEPSVAAGIAQLRDRGVRHIVVAPWFIAPGRITDRVAAAATAANAILADPLGPHPLVAATVCDRFDRALAERLVA